MMWVSNDKLAEMSRDSVVTDIRGKGKGQGQQLIDTQVLTH